MPRVGKRVRPFLRDWLGPMLRGIGKARTFGLAAEMSYWLFLSLVPLAAVAGWLGARLAVHHLWLEGGLLSAVPHEARAMVAGQVKEIASASGNRLAPLGLAMFVWFASTGMHAVFDVLEVQAGSTRPWWKKRFLAIVACIGLSIGVAAIGVLAVGADRTVAWLDPYVAHEIFDRTPAGTLARAAVALVAGTGMIAALYRVAIPREAWPTMPALPGAALAALLIGALGVGYRVYLENTGGGNAYQGSLAVIGVTLTTLWLFSVALLLGAELNRVLGQRRARDRPGSASSPGAERSAEPPLAGRLPYPDPERSRGRAPWPSFAAFSFRRTSRRPPITPSSGRSRLRSGSARRSR